MAANAGMSKRVRLGTGLKVFTSLCPKIGYAVGMSETVVQTNNSGKQWNVLHGGEIASAVGDEETIVFNTVQLLMNPPVGVAGVRISPETGGQDGISFRNYDGGQTWMDQPTNIPDILEDIFFIDANNGWVVGGKRYYLAHHKWRLIVGVSKRAEREEKLLSVRLCDSDVGWIVGGDYGCWHYPAYNQWWRNMGRQSLTENEAPNY